MRATTASLFYNTNVDEQLISEFTRHCSTAVRGYKCTSNDQLKNVSYILHGDLTDHKANKSTMEIPKTLIPVVKNEDENECKKCKLDVDVSGPGNNVPIEVKVMVNINK